MLKNSTLSDNQANDGGGVYNYQGPDTISVVEISDTILSAGASGENIFNDGGTITSHGYNIASDDGGVFLNGPGDQINTDPLLDPLQDNGGPTFTHALLPGSPAIDMGDPNSLRRLTAINAACVSSACSTAASTSVHLRLNLSRHLFRLQDRGRRQQHDQLRINVSERKPTV